MNQCFSLRRRATYGSIVQIGLKKASNGKDEYSVATFRRIYDFAGEELALIRSFANNFKEQIRGQLQQRSATGGGTHTGNTDEGNCYGGAEVLPIEAGERFCIGRIINGEHEALPA